MPTKYTPRITVIVAITLIFLWAIFPRPLKLFDRSLEFSKKTSLKPGIDISGGASLLYQINPPPGAIVESDLSERVMAILKRRVDPDGVRNLIWRTQGPTRIEIQMPSSGGGEEAKVALDKYVRARQQVDQLNLKEQDVLALVKGSAEDRARLKAMAGGSTARQNLIDGLIANHDTMTGATTANDAPAYGRAAAAFDALVAQIPDTNIDLIQVGQILAKPQTAGQRMQEVRERLGASPEALKALEEFVAAHKEFNERKNTIGDVGELKRLLRGSGVLQFHILVTDELNGDEAQKMTERLKRRGPTPMAGDTMRWFRVDRPEEMASFPRQTYDDEQWILAYTAPVVGSGQKPRALDKLLVPKQWNLKDVRGGRDYDSGKLAVDFELDTQGGVYFLELSSSNIGKPLGIVLDDRLISAPNLNTAIGERGQITGGFDNAEVDYLVRTLRAGSLPAQLAEEPLMERTVGPQIGHDNLKRGLWSCAFGLVVVAIFLIGYYHLSGVVAMVAVLMNLVVILGAMALFNATFTLPAIAGIILTIGMAVDANVLIFERLREEQQRGMPLRTALRNAYDRAFSAILDSNVTTGITAAILYILGSEEVKGFGLTLLIGLMSSLFTALFVTKTIFGLLIDRGGLSYLGSLPQAWPGLDRALRPNIDWIGKAKYFAVASAVLPVLGIVALVVYGRGKLLDVEFGAGTQIQFELNKPMPQAEVRKIIEDYDAVRVPSPSLVTVGSAEAGGHRVYEVITTNPSGKEVKAAVLEALKGRLAVREASDFVGRGKPLNEVKQIVLPVSLDTNFDAGFMPVSARSHLGGVAVVLKNIAPQLSPKEIRERLDAMRLEPGSPFAALSQKSLAVDGPGLATDPTDSAVVFLSDASMAGEIDTAQWRMAWSNNLAQPCWNLVNEAIHAAPQLERVNQFDASVAADMQLNAIAALALSVLGIMAYIWIRFGDLKYGTATVVGLMHDTICTVAALGFAHWLAQTRVGDALLIEPFRINLTMVAALLTVMGYSLNDKVVVFDRIRELRGKFGLLNRHVLNDAINQTLSRTLLTGGTTIVTIFVMYVWGGSGIHGFTFLLLCGILVGTYSSIVIAAPILLLGRRGETTGQRAVGRVQQVGS